MSYLNLTAVVRYDEAQQDDRRETDDGLECEGVDGALRDTQTHTQMNTRKHDIIVELMAVSHYKAQSMKWLLCNLIISHTFR